jgi:hypothetical protein
VRTNKSKYPQQITHKHRVRVALLIHCPSSRYCPKTSSSEVSGPASTDTKRRSTMYNDVDHCTALSLRYAGATICIPSSLNNRGNYVRRAP